MRKVILGLAVSLDGYIEGPNGEYDWCFMDQDYGMSDFLKEIDALLMGRKSYNLVKTLKGPNPWEGMITYVVSNTLKLDAVKNTQVISGDLETEIRKLKNSPGKNIWLFGGAQLTAAFINLRLVDELWLSVHPILLGAGKPLFQQIRERKTLTLLDVKQYSTGLVSLKYQLV